MVLKRVIRPTNIRIRLVVGLLLAVMFCIQCTSTDIFSGDMQVMAIADSSAVVTSPDRMKELERLGKTDHIGLLRKALENYSNSYQDYTCTFTKQERINGQFRDEQVIEVKFLDQPFSVAMRWVKNAPVGDRVLYVEGKHNGQMLVQPKGLLGALVGTVIRDPDGPDAMANTRRPVTLFGFKRLMESLLEVYELADSRNEGKFTFEGYRTKAKKVMVFKRVLPPKKDYPAKTTIWYLDVDYLVPIGLEASDWDDRQICRYSYSNVKFNTGLTEDEFTPKANGMKLK
ncbi:MAG: DUF1571 domain-containing protein [Planctomycetota bacterium]|nr:DUF1571 domain-containing protein [Planctomycetota bacterium]